MGGKDDSSVGIDGGECGHHSGDLGSVLTRCGLVEEQNIGLTAQGCTHSGAQSLSP
jgi:hypothetical protein